MSRSYAVLAVAGADPQVEAAGDRARTPASGPGDEHEAWRRRHDKVRLELEVHGLGHIAPLGQIDLRHVAYWLRRVSDPQ